jgi:hypothetical protein
VWREVLDVFLVPLRDRVVERAPLGEEHQVVGDLLRDHVPEEVAGIGALLRGREAGGRQPLEVGFEASPELLDREDLVDHPRTERTTHDAAHLERQLLGRVEPVDALRDDAFDGVRQIDVRAEVDPRAHGALAVAELEHPRVSERVGELIGEERVALGALGHEVRDRIGDLGDPEPTRDQLPDVRGRQPLERDRPAAMVLLDLGLLEAALLARDRPGRGQHHQRRDVAHHPQQQPPGGGVHPVGVFQAEQHPPGGRLLPEKVRQQRADRGGAGLALERAALLRLVEAKWQDALQRRRGRDEAGYTGQA